VAHSQTDMTQLKSPLLVQLAACSFVLPIAFASQQDSKSARQQVSKTARLTPPSYAGMTKIVHIRVHPFKL